MNTVRIIPSIEAAKKEWSRTEQKYLVTNKKNNRKKEQLLLKLDHQKVHGFFMIE